MPTRTAYLGLGSNLGDRQRQIEQGLRLLEARGLRMVGRSSLYLTEPVGGPPQEWYLNQVVAVETALAPEDLLEICLAVESELGRVRRERHGPRTMDVDLLIYDDEIRSTPALVLPHPGLHERPFVLVPLAEIAPDLRHPLLGLTAAEMLANCKSSARVIPYAATTAEAR